MSAEIEESIGRAVELMQAGRFGEADALFTEVLAGAPEQPDALHFAGLSRHAQGDLEGAISLLERATAAAPAHADAFNNLGSIYLQAGRAEDAERAFRAVLALQPESAAACFNLGVFLSRANRLEDAIPLLERAAKLEPSDPNAHERLGDARAKHRDFEAARAAYRQTRALGGGSKELLRKLGRVYFYLVDDADRRLVDREKTLAWLDEWLEIAPDDPIAKHTRAAYSGAAVPERASDDYVRATFDQFADSFDQVLANLEYKGPELCARGAGGGRRLPFGGACAARRGVRDGPRGAARTAVGRAARRRGSVGEDDREGARAARLRPARRGGDGRVSSEARGVVRRRGVRGSADVLRGSRAAREGARAGAEAWWRARGDGRAGAR
ncbi:MAG: tetratricopeptide repeat protein [Polyangiaceae bacterium]